MISITKVENNRVARYAEFSTLAECEAHAAEYDGIVYEWEYSPELWVENGKITLRDVEKTQAEINAEAKIYLSSTDWYILRKIDTGKEVPSGVLKQRELSRLAIKD